MLLLNCWEVNTDWVTIVPMSPFSLENNEDDILDLNFPQNGKETN